MAPEPVAVIVHVAMATRAELHHQTDDGFYGFLPALARLYRLGMEQHFLNGAAILRYITSGFSVLYSISTLFIIADVEWGQRRGLAEVERDIRKNGELAQLLLHLHSTPSLPLFYCHRLCQIAWLVYVAFAHDGDMIGQQLQRNDGQ